jgi:hypothetical protein
MQCEYVHQTSLVASEMLWVEMMTVWADLTQAS